MEFWKLTLTNIWIISFQAKENQQYLYYDHYQHILDIKTTVHKLVISLILTSILDLHRPENGMDILSVCYFTMNNLMGNCSTDQQWNPDISVIVMS